MINSQGDKGNTYKVTFTQRHPSNEGVDICGYLGEEHLNQRK